MPETNFQYRSIAKPAHGTYRDRGSKFFGYVLPVKSVEQVSEALNEIAGQHPKARHVCYAYRLGIEGNPFRINDDGEPSGSAGRPIYNELLSADLSDVLGVVVRYFGGTKLGIPGLIKAYKEAVKSALVTATIKEITLTRRVQIDYSIEDMGQIFEIIKSHNFLILESNYEPTPQIIIDVPLNKTIQIRASILADYFKYEIADIGEDFKTEKLKVTIL